MARLWNHLGNLGDEDFLEAMQQLMAERPKEPSALFEMASAHDSTGRADLAVPLHQRSLEQGFGPDRRRRAVIPVASSLRVLGMAERAREVLAAESSLQSDDLVPAVAALLALALADIGRAGQALRVCLEALPATLPRYARALAEYARELPACEGKRSWHPEARRPAAFGTCLGPTAG